MKKSLHLSLLAVALACAGSLSMAQTTTPAAANTAAPTQHRPMHDPAKMQAMMAKHMAEFKTKLQLTADQDPAWNTFAEAIKPPAESPKHMDRAEMAKLTTPQFIDKMHEMREQRNAAMDKREAATKTFYAQLTPSQQKVFDLEFRDHMRQMRSHFMEHMRAMMHHKGPQGEQQMHNPG